MIIRPLRYCDQYHEYQVVDGRKDICIYLLIRGVFKIHLLCLIGKHPCGCTRIQFKTHEAIGTGFHTIGVTEGFDEQVLFAFYLGADHFTGTFFGFRFLVVIEGKDIARKVIGELRTGEVIDEWGKECTVGSAYLIVRGYLLVVYTLFGSSLAVV